MAKNIWLLTEERPKRNVIQTILARFSAEIGAGYEFEDPTIVPIMKDGKFTFCYQFLGFKNTLVKEVFILPVSGYSSFVDFMLFYQDERPVSTDKPLLLIEETKTDDTESRNTGTYQRATKFVVTNYFYPKVKNIMLYNLQIPQKDKPTDTYVFGTRMLLTYGVEILGKEHDPNRYKPFATLEELIRAKNDMRKPGYGVPVRITQQHDRIEISARLEKNGRLGSDPSIGMLSLMTACIRKLGWQGRIVITRHGLSGEKAVGRKNKFIYVAKENNVELEGIPLPDVIWPKEYWQHEKVKEKTGTIFTHVIVENLTSGVAIYENHGGCERGYFLAISPQGTRPIAVQKYRDRALYKSGEKKAIVYIPDLVLWDKETNTVYDIEGKTFANRGKGVEELQNLEFFEKAIIGRSYPAATIERGLVLVGKGDVREAQNMKELSLYLDSDGSIILGAAAGSLIQSAVASLRSL